MAKKSWIDELNYECKNGKIRYSYCEENKEFYNYEGLKYAYDRVLNLFYSSSEHYFKRTQIIMIAIQASVIIGLTNLSKANNPICSAISLNKGNTLSNNIWIPFLIGFGLLSAFIWYLTINRHHSHLEFLRRYLREIEEQLTSLGLPFYMFTVERKMYSKDFSNNKHTFYTGECVPDYNKGIIALLNKISKHLRPRLGLMELEQWIVVLLILFWIELITLSLTCRFLPFPCSLIIFILVMLIGLVFFATDKFYEVGWWSKLWKRTPKGDN